MRIQDYSVLTGALALSLMPACKPTVDQPNIVLILADDMGFSDVGCYGSEIPTPNIDRMAEKGIRFTHFYNGARCCPTRASLLTGLYAHQTGLGGMTGDPTNAPGYQGEISQNCVTIAEVLKTAGYGTYMTGKWHLTAAEDGSDQHNWPCQRGFDHFYGTINGGGNFFHPRTLLNDNDFEQPDSNFYYTWKIAEHSSRFIREHKKKRPNDPFFLYAAFTAPHFPLHAPDSMIQRHKGIYDRGWDPIREARYKKQKSLGIIPDDLNLSERDHRIPDWDQEPYREWQIRRMEVYAAMVEGLDMGIGSILETLDELSITDETMVMFLSDNGGCAEVIGPSWLNFLKTLVGDTLDSRGRPMMFCNNPEVMPGPENTFQSVGLEWANVMNTPFRMYKHYIHEGGTSTPFIVQWPARIKEGGRLVHQPGILMDIMATLVAVSGAQYPEVFNNHTILPLEGHNLMPLIEEEGSTRHDYLFWEHGGNRGVQHKGWKLVAAGGKGAWELYHLDNDRIEMNNLADQYPDRVIELSEKWNEWAMRTHALPKPSNN